MGLGTTRFYLDDGTGTFPDDITDCVLLVDGFNLTRGRADTQSAPTAGTFNLTLNNAKPGKVGAFTPGSTILGSPSPIKVDQRIRVKETVNGVTYNRGTYYVKSWAVSWRSTTEASSVVRVTATDAQARAERRVLRSVVEEEIMLDGPTAYYTLGEPEGATSAGDTSGNQAPPLTSAGTVTFGTGTGPGTDGLTAATFAGGGYLIGTAATDVWGMECFFSTTTTPAAAMPLMTSPLGFAIVVDTGGRIRTDAADLSSPVVTDGATHHLMWRPGANVYLDGVDIGTPFASPAGNGAFSIGGGGRFGAGYATTPFVGTISHVGIYPSTAIPTNARTIAHASAGSTGFAGESGTARITRLAGYIGLTTGTLDASLTNVAFIDFTGQSAWQAIQDVCDAEMGVAYINGSGTLDFHNRQRVTIKTSPDLTLSAAVAGGFVRTDAEPVTDDQDLLNYIDVTAAATGASQVVSDSASETSHGRYPDSKTYLVATDDEALDRGNWLVGTRKEPPTSGRYGTLTVNLYGMSAVQQSAALAALEHGCWLRVTNMPSQTTGGTTVDVVVEGIAETQSGNNWEIACNVVSKTAMYPEVFILNSSVLDGTDLLGV